MDLNALRVAIEKEALETHLAGGDGYEDLFVPWQVFLCQESRVFHFSCIKSKFRTTAPTRKLGLQVHNELKATTEIYPLIVMMAVAQNLLWRPRHQTCSMILKHNPKTFFCANKKSPCAGIQLSASSTAS